MRCKVAPKHCRSFRPEGERPGEVARRRAHNGAQAGLDRTDKVVMLEVRVGLVGRRLAGIKSEESRRSGGRQRGRQVGRGRETERERIRCR